MSARTKRTKDTAPSNKEAVAASKKDIAAKEQDIAAAQAALDENLDKAEYSVRKARFMTEQLHEKWREHMFRLSFLVIIVSFHQCQLPMKECMKNIKLANSLIQEPDGIISGFQAFQFIVADALCEICGNLMMFSLAAFLAMKPPGTFSSLYYMISTAFIPLQLTAYFQMKKQVGCMDVLDEQAEEPLERQFPVSIVYHSIVTACYFFMEYQSKARDNDLQTLLKLRNEIIEARASKKKK